MSEAAVREGIRDASPRLQSKITGVVYLLFFLTAVLSQVFLKGLVVSGDAAATANNLLAHEPLFRLGLATGLISTACYIALTALFYELFKPVNRSVSLVAAFFGLAGCVIQAFGKLFQLAPFLVLGGSAYSSVFTGAELRAMALLSLQVNMQAVNIELVFFGFYCLLIGYLVFRSSFLPRILGALMAFAGFGWLTFLSPPLAAFLSPFILILGFLAELALCLWLLVRGINAERWKRVTINGD